MFSKADEVDSLSQGYDLIDIEQSGELIAITLSGPDTYFEFKGRGFGLQFDLAEDFARSIGVRLRMEVAHDTAEILDRLHRREVDVAAMELSKQNGMKLLSNRWLVSSDAVELAEAIDQWYTPDLVERIRKKRSANADAKHTVRRHPRPAMLNAAKGQISEYDALLQRGASALGWDWRLLAAQCYQESAFDPKAESWAGAQGLMQIMPATAASLGVDAADIFDPSTNIDAGVRYLQKLNKSFSDINPQSSRIPFMLAAYNGGVNHVRDAMALARKEGKNDAIWREVEPYILLLSEPRYYNDPVVKSGYLRGNETYGYVNSIMDRWMQYRGETRAVSSASTPSPSKNPRYQNEIRVPDSTLLMQ